MLRDVDVPMSYAYSVFIGGDRALADAGTAIGHWLSIVFPSAFS